ncbi:hypothetical protein VC116059_001379B, partial [Vibrio cholerae O1 str. 116059]
NIIILQTHL